MNMAGTKWETVDYYPDGRTQKALRRGFYFDDFKSAFEFVNKVAEIAEKQGHHPDINFGWGYATVWSTSHDAHGITDKDKELTKLIDELV